MLKNQLIQSQQQYEKQKNSSGRISGFTSLLNGRGHNAPITSINAANNGSSRHQIVENQPSNVDVQQMQPNMSSVESQVYLNL